MLAALCAFVACMIMLLPARSNHRERDESSASDRMVVFSIGGGRRGEAGRRAAKLWRALPRLYWHRLLPVNTHFAAFNFSRAARLTFLRTAPNSKVQQAFQDLPTILVNPPNNFRKLQAIHRNRRSSHRSSSKFLGNFTVFQHIAGNCT